MVATVLDVQEIENSIGLARSIFHRDSRDVLRGEHSHWHPVIPVGMTSRRTTVIVPRGIGLTNLPGFVIGNMQKIIREKRVVFFRRVN